MKAASGRESRSKADQAGDRSRLERTINNLEVGRFWKFKREEVNAWVRDGGAASSSDELAEKERKHG